MHTQIEIVTFKNLVKLKQDYFFHAKFLEEIQYASFWSSTIPGKNEVKSKLEL